MKKSNQEEPFSDPKLLNGNVKSCFVSCFSCRITLRSSHLCSTANKNQACNLAHVKMMNTQIIQINNERTPLILRLWFHLLSCIGVCEIRVNPLMSFQVAFLGKPFPAVRADVGSLSRVNPAVGF